MERLQTDTTNYKENVEPLIGGTDIIIFAFGADINNGGVYTGDEKFNYLKSVSYTHLVEISVQRAQLYQYFPGNVFHGRD